MKGCVGVSVGVGVCVAPNGGVGAGRRARVFISCMLSIICWNCVPVSEAVRAMVSWMLSTETLRFTMDPRISLFTSSWALNRLSTDASNGDGCVCGGATSSSMFSTV